MGIFDGTGLSAELYTPIWASNAGQAVEPELGAFLEDLSKEEAADGGYTNASFTAVVHQSLVDIWLQRLGYDFQLFSDSQQMVWRGFINEITVDYGAYTISVGPLLSIANRVGVEYQTMSYNTNPPIGGNQAATAVANDTISQERYGILETNISGGQGLAADMTQLRDTYLAEYKEPFKDRQINLGRISTPSVKADIIGYYQLLDRFYFSQSGTGTQAANVKIAAVLAAHPTLTFVTDDITGNALAVPLYSDGSKTGLAEIRNIVVKGDSSDRRYIFGSYGLNAYYTPIETTADQVTYYHVQTADGDYITDQAGSIISPWDIEAGKWLRTISLEIGQNLTLDNNLRTDDQVLFIETVAYSAPDTLNITGGRTSKLAQKMAKLGLGGM